MTTPKYKVGQRVKIKSDLKSGVKYGTLIYHGTSPIAGSKLGTIQNIIEVASHKESFVYLFNDSKFWWSEKMLDHTFVDEPESTEFKVGDICEANGAQGKVTDIFPFGYIQVMFKKNFLKDGREEIFHKTPSLKLIHRAEVVKPVYEYQYVYTDKYGRTRLTEDENTENGEFFISKAEMKIKLNTLGYPKYLTHHIRTAKRLARSKRERK